MNATEKANVQKVIQWARTAIGYRALAFNNTVYGTKTNTQGLTWDAPFLRSGFEEAGLRLDSGSRATSLYEDFVEDTRVYSEPIPGDIAFFAWGSGLDGDGQPHVGLVTDTKYWNSHRRFSCVEATNDVVQELLRFNTDALAFGRPRYQTPPARPRSDTRIRLSELQGRVESRHYIPIQTALASVRNLSAYRNGHWDRQCESAYASWQRHLGMVRADGKLELAGLTALGYASGKFTIEA